MKIEAPLIAQERKAGQFIILRVDEKGERIPLTIAEATLGAEIDIPVLGGKTEKFNIPEGTQTGTSFTLRGKGIMDLNTKRRGDLVITAVVDTPQNLTSKQKELLKAFAASLGENNNKKSSGFFKKIFNK